MKSSCFIPSSLLRVTAAAVNRQRASVPAPHLRCAASCYHDWGMMVCHSKNRKPSRRHPQPQILFSNHYYCYYYYNPSSCSRQQPPQQRSFTFSFAGPRLLEELLKPDAVVDKSGTEVADLWYTYHEGKVRACVRTILATRDACARRVFFSSSEDFGKRLACFSSGVCVCVSLTARFTVPLLVQHTRQTL